jgi:Uma2 family endonuclease
MVKPYPMLETPSLPKKLLLELPDTLVLQITQEQFELLALTNRELKLERTAQGDLIVNPPTGWETGERNWSISGELYLWWRNAGQIGKGFDSSTGFILPNGATRSPDACWISPERWSELTIAPSKGFVRLCPDFVVELRSDTDGLADLQTKMQEYLDNGAKLGWLIDPKHRRVYVYRQGQPLEQLEDPLELSGEDVVPGFMLDLRQIWGS